MNNLGIKLKSNKKLVKVIGFLVIIGFLIGFFVYKKIDNKDIILEITNLEDNLINNNLSFLAIHFSAISILITSSFIGLGFILFPLYFLMEIVTVSYNTCIFMEVFKLKGFLFAFLYSFLTKFVYLGLLILLAKKIFNIIKVFRKFFSNKEDASFRLVLLKNFKQILVLVIFMFVNDLFIYMLGNKILLKLLFIIK